MKNLKKTIAEYKLCKIEFEFEIKGRILKEIQSENELQFSWEVSHFFKPGEMAGAVYRPSKTLCKSEEEATNLLFLYLNTFQNIGVEKNENY